MTRLKKIKFRNPYHRGDSDLTEHAQIFIDPLHRRIHDGQAFTASFIFEAISNNADGDLLLKIGARNIHITFRSGVEDDTFQCLFENPTIDTDSTGPLNGTPVIIFDKNRVTNNTPLCTAFHTPTISTDSAGDLPGTLIFATIIRPGDGIRTFSVDPAQHDEWLLAANTDYLLRITNKAGVAKDASMAFTFYEEL